MATVDEVFGPGARRSPQVAVQVRRPRISWPVVLAGLAGLAIVIPAAAEVISALMHSPVRFLPVVQAAGYAEGARWSDPSVRIASGVLGLIGVMLISMSLLPWRLHRPGEAATVPREAERSRSRRLRRFLSASGQPAAIVRSWRSGGRNRSGGPVAAEGV